MAVTAQLSLLAPGQSGACPADCEICGGAERIWGHVRRGDSAAFEAISVWLHESGGALAEAYARARGAWP